MAHPRLFLAAVLAFASSPWPAPSFQGLTSDSAPVIEPRNRVDRLGFKPELPGASLPPANLRADVSLVLVPAHVTTSRGTPVNDLAKDNFRIFEDGVEQRLTYFGWDDAPVSVGFLLDASASMRNKMHQASDAAASFFGTANKGDEFFLVEFNERAKLLLPFTADAAAVSQRVSHVHPIGRTALLDAVHLAMMQMKKAHNGRKALVIVSDGGDNRSRYSFPEIREMVKESEIQIYCMGIYDPEDQRKRTPEEQNGPQLMSDLAEQSGGKQLNVANLDDLPALGEQIGEELRSQYVLGYSPAGPESNNKYRRITVKLDGERARDLEITYRRGYNTPGE